MRIDAFQPADQFKSKMDEWIGTFRNAESAPGKPKIVIPGDPERENEELYKKNGITIIPGILKDIKLIADYFGIEFIEK